MLFAEVFGAAPAQTAQYVVDGISLGDRVAPGGSKYRSYGCQPSNEFANATHCERTQILKGSLGRLTVVHALIHARDGTAMYIMADAAPVLLSKQIIQRELDDLTRSIHAPPARVEYNRQDNPTAVIAIWGDVKLEELSSDDLMSLSKGQSPHQGVLVDYLGNLRYSAENFSSVYRIAGGAGYVYAADVDASGRGHRHYVAVNGSELAIRRFQMSLESLLQKDRSLAADDYRLWPDVANATRNLALDTSVKIANSVLDQVFNSFHANKLRSHVWAMLPLGATQRLSKHIYSRLDNYGAQTKYPKVRSDIESFLAHHRSDPFIEFAYFLIGDFDKAIAANPHSVISDVLHYASGYGTLRSLLYDTLNVLKTHVSPTTPPGVRDELKFMSADNTDFGYRVLRVMRLSVDYPELHDNRPLDSIVPNYSSRAIAAQSQFHAVLRWPSSPLADDAAYRLGWLALQQGESDRALAYFSQAMVVGNGDYRPMAVAHVVRRLKKLSAREQIDTVELDPIYAQQPPLWYLAARSAYRNFDYALAIDTAQRALQAINIPIEQLPVTTDPNRIETALERINARASQNPNVYELPYLVQASKEFLQYQTYLKSIQEQPPDAVTRKVRAIIIKYSMLHDPPNTPAHARPLGHRDLRQAIHLIDITLQQVPKDAYARLREWLYYRKIWAMAEFSPRKLPQAIAAFQREFPTSKLLNDALAEQIFAEGIMMKNPEAAKATFQELLEKYPNGNAVDNGYSWMEITMRCAGRLQEANSINEEIIRRFPFTRHAVYARKRLADPKRYVDRNSCGL